MDISVVIPTYNRADLLRRTIPALANQQTSDLTYEVIFVSNGSSDHTSDVLEEAANRYPGRIRYFVIPPTGGPSAPRNRGIGEAAGDVLIILDDDVLPDADLVMRHAAFHASYPEPRQAAIGELYVSSSCMEDPMSLFHTFPYDEVRGLDRLNYLHFWTCNVSIKRDFMRDAGMFDESFLYYEDVVCGYQLQRNNMELHFWPSARGQHLHQLKPSGVASKGLFTGLWLHAFLEKIPDPASRMRFGVLSMDLPASVIVRRALGRIAFRIVDNPLTIACLKTLGATGERRSFITDVYYRIVFRRNLMAGLRQARRQAKTSAPEAKLDQQWVNRGES
jgi:glycosyltransferase involved in cell wall biosynthesis